MQLQPSTGPLALLTVEGTKPYSPAHGRTYFFSENAFGAREGRWPGGRSPWRRAPGPFMLEAMSEVTTGPRDVRVFAAAMLGCLWLSVLEYAGTRLRVPLSFVESAWLIVSTACLTAILAMPIGLGVLLVTRWRPIGRAVTSLERVPWLRWVLASIALLGSLALHWINTTYYVRLYLFVHLLLTAGTMCLAIGGWSLALPLRPRAQRDLGRKQLTLLATSSGAWLIALAITLWMTVDSYRLRSLAIEDTTMLAHELILLDQLTGVLAPPSIEGVDLVPAALSRQLEARPVVASEGKRHNIVLLTVDSLRADRLLASGARTGQLPRLERLSEESLTFSHAYSTSCWTIHSMSSVLTSHLASALDFEHVSVAPDLRFTIRSEARLIENPAFRKQVTPVPIRDEHATLASMLRAAGYWTGTVVPYVFYLRDAGVTRDFEVVDEAAYRSLPIDGSGITKVSLVDRALTILEQRDSKRPFFLWLHFMEPHAPYEARDDRAIGGSDIDRYDSELRFVDGEIGRLLDALTERALLDDSIVIVHADHGEEFRDHGGEFHATTLYDEIIRVPLIVRIPGAEHRVISSPVSLLDLTPTILDLTGVDSGAPLMGRSFKDAILGGRELGPRPILAECSRFGRSKKALILPPFKLIVDENLGAVQLFDWRNDPGERSNLADEHRDETMGLLAVLEAIQQQIARDADTRGARSQPVPSP